MEKRELKKVLAGFGLAALIAGAAVGCHHRGASGCGGGKSGCGGCGGSKGADKQTPPGQQQTPPGQQQQPGGSGCGGMKK